MDFYEKWSVVFIDRLMKDFKLGLFDAVAIIGNAGHESGGFKQLQELKPLVTGSKGGWGIMQWTGPRRREAEAYWKRNNLNPSDMDANYKFLFVELSGPEGKVLAKLRDGDTLNDKVEIFSKVFLRPGIPHMESRYKWAEKALRAHEAHTRTQKPTESVPVPKAIPNTPWWLELLLSLLRRK